MASIGPQLPPHLIKQHKDGASDDKVGPQPVRAATDEDEDDDDSYGPALPPDLLVRRPAASSGAPRVGPSAPSPPPQTRRVLGPTLPGHDRQAYGDDDNDNGYGPMPLPAGAGSTDAVSEGVREFLEKEEKRRREIEEAAKPKRPKREEWMLVPPSSSDLLGHLSDPTKLKARQFSRGGGAASRSAPNNLWTETPAERQQRIADEVSGKKRRAANADEDAAANPKDDHKRRKKDEEIRKVVEQHNKSARAKTLLEMHSSAGGDSEKKGTKGKDGDEPPVIWDHSRDMALGGRLMDEKQRNKLITDARSLGDRFGSGKRGGYL